MTPTICFHTYNMNTINKGVNTPQKFSKRLQPKSKLSMGVEHLVECSKTAKANGFLNSDMCLDHDMNHIMQMLVTDIFERIVTIGLLVAAYFYFKRLAITQPVNEDYTTSSVTDSNRYTNDYYNSNDQPLQCPKCNGTGNNLFNKSLVCDICGGTGDIYIPKPREFNLPSNPSSRSSAARLVDESYSDDDDL